MTKHVLGWRSGYGADFALYVGADDLQWLIGAGKPAATFWPSRQFAIFTRHPPAPWWTGKRRYVFGLSDGALYQKKYGERQPFPNGLGQMMHNFDHHHTGAT